jgi:DNA-binding MarR family transcriptional regulator
MTAVPPAAADATPAEKMVLLVLKRDEWLTVNDIAARTHHRRTTLYTALDRLREREYVERRQSPGHPNAYEYRIAV